MASQQYVGHLPESGGLMPQLKDKFAQVSSEIKILIRDGYYSFYEIVDGRHSGNYLLLTDEKRFYILSPSGEVLEELFSIPDFKLQKANLDTSSITHPTRKLNYA